MTQWLRFLWLLLTAPFRRRIPVMATAVLAGRVLPNDCDINLHLNNARYLSIMDLGRLDFMVRTGLLPIIVRNRLRPVIGSATMRWRRSLAPFEKYYLETRVLFWDDRRFWLEQRFRRADGKTAAIGIVKALFLEKDGTRLPPEQLLATLTDTPPPRPITPSWADAMSDVEAELDPAA